MIGETSTTRQRDRTPLLAARNAKQEEKTYRRPSVPGVILHDQDMPRFMR